jgi:glyoxylase-like metal-dependent hydrolase (beta-lactamase superfamily II)
VAVATPTHTAAETAKLRARPRALGLAAAAAEKVADGVWLVRGGLTRTMNAYLIEDGDGVVVFDTGEKGMAVPIAEAAKRLGGIKRIVLGHGDTDHRGSAPALSAIAPVECHPDAVPYAEGRGGREYWHPEQLPPQVRVLHGFLHDHVWDGGPVQISGTVREGDEVAGFTVVDLPGHAPGLIGLWRASDRLAIVSDCFYLTDMYGRHVPPIVPNDAYNFDTDQARVSIRKLADMDPAECAPGHLGPLTGPDVREQLLGAAGVQP